MTSCVICGSLLISPIETEKETVYCCSSCGYGRPSLREPIFYDAAYEEKYLAYPELQISAVRMGFVQKSELLTGFGFNILDYGCGSGAFIRYARKYGRNAYGVDVNDFTADLRPPRGFVPDIVTAWDSFEHLTDEEQDKFFKDAAAARTVILSVPDFASRPAEIAEWRHYRPREHLHYYTEIALVKLFNQRGYSKIFVSHAEDSIRVAPWPNNILTVGFKRG